MAFHYDVSHVEEIVPNIEDEDLFFILPEEPAPANALYCFAEMGIIKSSAKIFGSDDEEGLSSFVEQTKLAASQCIKIISSILNMLIDKKLGNPTIDLKKIDATSVPRFDDIEIPFFSDLERRQTGE